MMEKNKQRLLMYLMVGIVLLTGCGTKAAGAVNKP